MHWLIFVLYFVTRLPSLTKLPVFADEAIYIRWAQMMKNDPGQYFFIPLYDGKTPLQMWLLNLFLPFNPPDPLWISRFFAVLTGAATLFVLMKLTKRLQDNSKAILLTGMLYIFTPFAFFHDRLALTDALLVFFLSLTTYILLSFNKYSSFQISLFSGLAYGLALLSKLPAIFYLPHFFVVWWLFVKGRKQKVAEGRAFLGSMIISFMMLGLLRISPLFPFLFQRSGDFTIALPALLSGSLSHVPHNIHMLVSWLLWYAPVLVLVSLLALWRKNRTALILILMALIWAAPFLLLGKIVYSRYYLPMIIFLIPAAAVVLAQAKSYWLILLSTVYFIWFSLPLYTNVFAAHLPKADQEQYLSVWSAGFGIPEVRDFLTSEAATKKVAVATEGYFGTLPDGLLMYFDRLEVIKNLRIFGIGTPVYAVPVELRELTPEYETYLFVNTSRLQFDYRSCCELVGEYPRPYSADSALLLKVLR
jgi:4-amino-4-deoxy-L-arabinose transferase-like glycosyltransferase